jgi:hypothetical protein
MPWLARFAAPIALPDRRPLCTLAEARGYILELSEADRDRIEWRTAWGILVQAAEDGEPYTAMAQIAIERALRKRQYASSQPR